VAARSPHGSLRRVSSSPGWDARARNFACPPHAHGSQADPLPSRARSIPDLWPTRCRRTFGLVQTGRRWSGWTSVCTTGRCGACGARSSRRRRKPAETAPSSTTRTRVPRSWISSQPFDSAGGAVLLVTFKLYKLIRGLTCTFVSKSTMTRFSDTRGFGGGAERSAHFT
jgi:hypothetical protein